MSTCRLSKPATSLVRSFVSASAYEPTSYVYLASPYTKYAKGLDAAHRDTADLFAELTKMGLVGVSPILLTHNVCASHQLPSHAEYWQVYNTALLHSASAIFVLMMEGWQESSGVTWEIQTATRFGLPILSLPVEYREENDNQPWLPFVSAASACNQLRNQLAT